MAEHMIETRILLRYDTYSNWMNSTTILKQGEAAVCAFPRNRVIEDLSNSMPENTPPAIGIKIGDGIHYFRELPWIQAIAADVYNWAKQSYKPSYSAQEIEGLQAYVEELIGGGTGGVTIAPRIYQLYQGSGDNENKYYLRYKENDENNNWILDTSTYIDLNDLIKIREWIGSFLDEYVTLGTATGMQTRTLIGRLNYTDNPRDNYFVTSVSENAGIISVERGRPTFANISGTVSVEQGGTGRTSLTEDSVLVGNGTDQVKLIPIAESITNNNHLVPNYLIKAYVDSATTGLTGAMHFVGEATVVINNNSAIDPQISDYNFSNAQPGDVILYNTKEFVWTGGRWRLLGDEGSYAIKGSIMDADISLDANISQNKIANLSETFSTKVDKVDGKTLTSNDFTDELKEKLDYIETGAQRNIIEHIFLNGQEIRPSEISELPKSINLQVKEFDDQSAQKLAGIQAGAQVNLIEKIIYGSEEIKPDANKTITITPDPHTEHENKIESIIINGVEQIPDKNKQVKITIDDAALNLQVIKGAKVPGAESYENVDITPEKELILSRIAKTGDINDILQSTNSYVILNCGNSMEVL